MRYILQITKKKSFHDVILNSENGCCYVRYQGGACRFSTGKRKKITDQACAEVEEIRDVVVKQGHEDFFLLYQRTRLCVP